MMFDLWTSVGTEGRRESAGEVQVSLYGRVGENSGVYEEVNGTVEGSESDRMGVQ